MKVRRDRFKMRISLTAYMKIPYSTFLLCKYGYEINEKYERRGVSN
jgi:hypothetical protein